VLPVTNVQVTALDEVGTTLLRAASTLLADEGAAALTVRRIAAEAGMSTMNVYSRFGSKQGVVDQLFLQGFELLAAAMTEVPLTDDPVADLQRCGQAYRRFAHEHETLYSVMFDRVVPDHEPGPTALTSAFATLRQLADRLQRCIDAGRVRPADSLHLAAIVWASCHGVVSLELRQKMSAVVDWESVFRDMSANLVAGLAP
jgi:AcrR family transcriptional regulator